MAAKPAARFETPGMRRKNANVRATSAANQKKFSSWKRNGFVAP
jgi:hypothetical protein